MKLLLCLLVCALALSLASALTMKERQVAKFAVNSLGRGYYLVKIRSVERQVVRGTMYHVKAKVRYQIPGGIGKNLKCYIKVWERPYGRRTVESSKCK